MNKTRLEAFSDGVFAIVITLLILNIRLPDVDYSHLQQALQALIPNILAYVMSFLVIGLYWVIHHNSFQFVAKIDRGILWLNILLLLFVSFLPFPAYMFGKYPFKELPVIIYGCNLLLANITGFFIVLYIWYHPDLKSEEFTDKVFKKSLSRYLGVNSVYIIALLLAFVNPTVSYWMYGAMLFVLIILFGQVNRRHHSR